MGEAAEHTPAGAGSASPAPPEPTAESERILLLECRLEKVSSALAETRADADRLRGRLAEAAAREADHARRYSFVHQDLAEARADVASLHERLNWSEALRAELEGHLFEAGSASDAAELIRLRRDVLSQRQRALVGEQTSARLRARVDELLISRETLLTRVAEWQWLVQKGNPGAVDLGEFIAELRRDILVLENRNAVSDRQELALRELLVRAGVEPPVDQQPAIAETPRPNITEPFRTVEVPEATTFEEFLSIAGASKALGDFYDAEPDWDREDNAIELPEAPHDSLPLDPLPSPASVEEPKAVDSAITAASYGRLIQALEVNPSQLADQLRPGLADADPRVRRRAVLAAATARNLALRPLLDPLRDDPDPHVRRVVREVLRHAPDEPFNAQEKTVGLAPGTR
ncbi:MAG: hypothetical protein ACRENP_08250 [Longimicrobiales bacterium]